MNPGDRYLLCYSFSCICLKFLFHCKVRSKGGGHSPWSRWKPPAPGSWAGSPRPPPSGFQVGRVFLSLFSFSPSPAPPLRQVPLFQFYLLKVMTLPRLRPPPCDGLAAALSVTSVPPSPASFSLGMPHCFEDKVQAPSSVCEAAWPGRPSPCQRHGGRRVDDVLHPEAPSAAALPPQGAPAASCLLPPPWAASPAPHPAPARPPARSCVILGKSLDPSVPVFSSAGPDRGNGASGTKRSGRGSLGE